jgi:serine/threonine-protein kinase
MSQESILAELLLRWDDLAAGGAEPSVEELCRTCPQLAPELARRIRVLRRWDAARRAVAGQTDPRRGADGGGTAEPPFPRVPGYEVLERIGQGGMGIVYRARQVSLGRLVALKLIRSEALAEPAERQRFHDEARAIAAVKHPGIVEVYEFGTHEGVPFIALEFCAGGNLADRLAGAPLPARAAARLVGQLGLAVQAAHAAGVVHRDLKPANVLLAGTPRGHKRPAC